MRSIVTKLWITIVALVVGVLLISGFLLSGILTKHYFDQQATSLINKGRVVSAYLLKDEEQTAIEKAQILADEARATIVIADPTGLVRGCSPGMQRRFMHGLHLNETEMEALKKGQEIIRIGNSPYFESKMLWVAVPVLENDQLIRTVVLYAPLEPIAANIKQVQNLMIMVGVGGILVATVLALLLSKTLSRPLLEMNAAATKMIHGDFATKVQVTSEDELGRLGKTLNSLSDELAKTLSALAYEKDQLHNVLASMTDGVITFSTQGEIILLNPRAEQLLAQNGSSVQLGGHLDQCCPVEEVQAMFREVLATGVGGTAEFSVGRVILSVRMAPLLENAQVIRGVVALLQDVTKERRLEKMRKDFVANVSHELRTPLCLMQGYGEALLDGLDEDRQQRTEMVGIMVDETKRMQRLVNELLDLAKMEAGGVSLVKESVNVDYLLNKIVKKFEGVSKDAGVSIQCTVSPDLPPFRADFDRLEQILTNLVDNACRHTTRGGNIVLAGLISGNQLILRVSDTGQGISAEDLEHIWDRFYKADKARTRNQGGTGLGLSIVKALVEAHGGSIEAQSIVGEGTTFIMAFPI